MKSTAGYLYTCVLLFLQLFCAPEAKPINCSLTSLVELTKEYMKTTLHEYKTLHAKLPHSSQNFPQLHFNSTPADQVKNYALCGVSFMEYALEKILGHQKLLNYDKESLLRNIKDVIQTEKHLKACINHTLQGQTETHKPYPTFPEDDFEGKRWGLDVLKKSVEFLDALAKFLKTSHQTK